MSLEILETLPVFAIAHQLCHLLYHGLMNTHPLVYLPKYWSCQRVVPSENGLIEFSVSILEEECQNINATSDWGEGGSVTFVW